MAAQDIQKSNLDQKLDEWSLKIQKFVVYKLSKWLGTLQLCRWFLKK